MPFLSLSLVEILLLWACLDRGCLKATVQRELVALALSSLANQFGVEATSVTPPSALTVATALVALPSASLAVNVEAVPAALQVPRVPEKASVCAVICKDAHDLASDIAAASNALAAALFC